MDLHDLENKLDDVPCFLSIETRGESSDDSVAVPGHLCDYVSIHFLAGCIGKTCVDMNKNTGKLYLGNLDYDDVPCDLMAILKEYKGDCGNMDLDTKDINKVIKNDIKKLAKDITKKRISDKKSKLGKKILGEVEKKFQINVSEPKKSKDHKKSDK